MTYLLTQLWLSLLIAGLIGSVLGWILRGGCKRYKKAMQDMELECFELEEEMDRHKQKSKGVAQLRHQKNVLMTEVRSLKIVKKQNQQLLLNLQKMRHGAKKARAIYMHTDRKLKKMEAIISFAKKSNEVKDSNIKQIKREAIVVDNLLLKTQAKWKQKYQVLQGELADKSIEVSDDTQRVLAVMEAKVSEKESAWSDLNSRINDVENEKKAVFDQLTQFKEESKGYIIKVTQDNEKYKKAVDLLQVDIQQLHDQNDGIKVELETTKDALEDKECELIKFSETESIISDLYQKNDRVEAELEKTTDTLNNKRQEIAELKRLLESKVDTGYSNKKRKSEVVLDASQQEKGGLVEKINVFSRAGKSFKKIAGLGRVEVDNVEVDKEKAVLISSVESSVDHSVEIIYGVGRAYSERLEYHGISSTQGLLHYLYQGLHHGDDVAKNKKIKQLSELINVQESDMQSWAKMADLLRLKGVSNEYAKSLELSGIYSVEDLATRKVSEVSTKMERSMQNERRIKNTPEDKEIYAWITQAKEMGDLVEGVSESVNDNDGSDKNSSDDKVVILSSPVDSSVMNVANIKHSSLGWKSMKRFKKRR